MCCIVNSFFPVIKAGLPLLYIYSIGLRKHQRAVLKEENEKYMCA